jgi:hypothetical protein
MVRRWSLPGHFLALYYPTQTSGNPARFSPLPKIHPKLNAPVMVVRVVVSGGGGVARSCSSDASRFSLGPARVRTCRGSEPNPTPFSHVHCRSRPTPIGLVPYTIPIPQTLMTTLPKTDTNCTAPSDASNNW